MEIVHSVDSVSYTHLRAHETREDLVCRLLLEKKINRKVKNLCNVYNFPNYDPEVGQ